MVSVLKKVWPGNVVKSDTDWFCDGQESATWEFNIGMKSEWMKTQVCENQGKEVSRKREQQKLRSRGRKELGVFQRQMTTLLQSWAWGREGRAEALTRSCRSMGVRVQESGIYANCDGKPWGDSRHVKDMLWFTFTRHHSNFSPKNGLQGARREGRHPSYKLLTQYCLQLQRKLSKI